MQAGGQTDRPFMMRQHLPATYGLSGLYCSFARPLSSAVSFPDPPRRPQAP